MYSQGVGRRKQIACLLQLNILNARTSLVPTTSLSHRGKNSKWKKNSTLCSNIMNSGKQMKKPLLHLGGTTLVSYDCYVK